MVKKIHLLMRKNTETNEVKPLVGNDNPLLVNSSIFELQQDAKENNYPYQYYKEIIEIHL